MLMKKIKALQAYHGQGSIRADVFRNKFCKQAASFALVRIGS